MSQQFAAEWLKALPKDARHIQVQINSLCTRIQLGQHADAIVIAEDLREKIGAGDDAARFRLARVYALASAVAADTNVQEDYRTKALTALQQAGDALTEQRLILDDDLEPIRADPRFKSIVELAKKKR